MFSLFAFDTIIAIVCAITTLILTVLRTGKDSAMSCARML